MPRPSPPLLALALAVALTVTAAACAAAGGDEGGAASLPERGVAPWERIEPDDEPFVLRPPPSSGLRYDEPAALVVDDQVRLYFDERGPDGARVLAADSADGLAFDAPREVLADAQAPSPAIGPDGRVWLAFATADEGAIGLAASDDGLSFDVEATSLTAEPDERLGGPSLIVVDDRLVVFYTTTTTTTTAEGDVVTSAIARASATPGAPLEREGVVFEAGRDCVERDGAPAPCWDGGVVTSPDVRLAVTAADRRVYRLFYRGARGASGDLGFAASWDGFAFSRYPFNPVVAERFDERAPSQVRLGDTFLLYWSEQRTAATHGLAVGVHVTTAPSERFE